MTNLQPKSILIVDDNTTNIRVLLDILKDFQRYVAKSGKSALSKAQEVLPDLILLDIKLPGIDGFETCRRLKAEPKTEEIPVIFLSALDEEIDKVKAFGVGGVDYITKPYQNREVLVRVQNQFKTLEAKAENRQLNAQLEQRVRERTVELSATNQKLEREIIERQKVEKELYDRTLQDPLTNLGNRSLLMQRLEAAFKRAKQHPNYLFALLFIDIDRFKVVNDSRGHQVGDRLLEAVALKLKEIVRSTDTLARLGGDEFIILLDRIENIDDAKQIAEKIVQELILPLQIEERPMYTSVSIGIALSSTECNGGTDLLRNADTAMYRAKKNGRKRYEVFDREMYAEACKRHQIENDLPQALEQQQFRVYYQPIICLKKRRVAGFEALIRWLHPTKGLISPDEFIPIAEETGLIVPIGEWVLREAAWQMSDWQTRFDFAQSLKISVNVSTRQIEQANFLEKIDEILEQTKLLGNSLILELTESIVMENAEKFIEFLSSLNARGIEMAFDDFGTGYSNLKYLQTFPVHNLKADRSFVSGIKEQVNNDEILKTIVALAKQFKMKAIAEGVETPEQRDQVVDLRYDAAQGYLFSKPMEPETAEAFMLNFQWK